MKHMLKVSVWFGMGIEAMQTHEHQEVNLFIAETEDNYTVHVLRGKDYLKEFLAWLE